MLIKVTESEIPVLEVCFYIEIRYAPAGIVFRKTWRAEAWKRVLEEFKTCAGVDMFAHDVDIGERVGSSPIINLIGAILDFRVELRDEDVALDTTCDDDTIVALRHRAD